MCKSQSWIFVRFSLQSVMCEAVIFDLDGTLTDSEVYWHKMEIEHFARVGHELTTAHCESTQGMRMDMIVQKYWDEKPWDESIVSREQLTNDIIDGVIRCQREKAVPTPGVHAAFDFVQSKNVQIGLATSSPIPLMEASLEGLGIKDKFDFTQSGAELENPKPAPDVYLLAAKGLDAEPSSCVAIEDTLTGVKSAKAAGMWCIAVPSQSGRDDEFTRYADVVIPSLKLLDESLWQKLLASPPKPFHAVRRIS